MCTIYTHGVVGLGAGTLYARSKMPARFWMLAALLPMLPDADSFWDAPYGSMLGHRGFTHSLLFALLVSFAAAMLLRHRLSYVPLVVFFFIIIGSHGVLDAFTDGGFGIPLLWPFSSHRFGPWGPIRVSDIGFEIPTGGPAAPCTLSFCTFGCRWPSSSPSGRSSGHGREAERVPARLSAPRFDVWAAQKYNSHEET
jgi:inner membrane protein